MRPSGFCLTIAGLVYSASATLAQTTTSIDLLGGVPVATIHAQGAQVYRCRTDAVGRLTWHFHEPIATLLAGGETAGRHYAGPSWEFLDGTVLRAKVVARAPGATAGDIPSLLLSVDQIKGIGPLSEATIIRRENTRGGFISGPCQQAGAFLSVAYSADYTFLKETANQ